MKRFFFLILLTCILWRPGWLYSQNIAINTDGSAAESGVMLDVKGSNAKSAIGLQTLFQLKSNNTTSPDDAFKLRFGLRTHSTPGNRYGFMDAADLSAGTPSYRLLCLQPSGGAVSIGSTNEVLKLYVYDNVNTVSGIYGHNPNSGSSAYTEVAAASDAAQASLLAFSSTFSPSQKQNRAVLQSESTGTGLDFSADGSSGNFKFFPGGTYTTSNNNIPGGTDIFRISPPTASHPNGRFGVIEGGSSPSYYTYFKGGNQASEINYTLPVDDGTASQILTTDGSGVLSWTTPSAASTGGCTGDWTLVAVANMTYGSTGDFWSGFTMASNKEYLVVSVGYCCLGADQFTLSTSDAVALFGPSFRPYNASSVANVYDEVIGFFCTLGGSPCNISSYTGWIRVSGKLKNASITTAINFGSNLNTLACGTPTAIWIRLKGTGEIGFNAGDPSSDVGLYIFER